MKNIIGYWRSEDELDLPDPAWFVDYDWNKDVKQAVIDYLERGSLSVVSAGYSWCRFRCKARLVGCAELSDGLFQWPEGLSHYLKYHGVRLPDEFVDYVLKKVKSEKYDYDFCYNWWKEQKGWRNESSFINSGFGGTLSIIPQNINEIKKVMLFLRKFELTANYSTKELLDLLKTKQEIFISKKIDYCEVVELMKETVGLGVELIFKDR